MESIISHVRFFFETKIGRTAQDAIAENIDQVLHLKKTVAIFKDRYLDYGMENVSFDMKYEGLRSRSFIQVQGLWRSDIGNGTYFINYVSVVVTFSFVLENVELIHLFSYKLILGIRIGVYVLPFLLSQ